MISEILLGICLIMYNSGEDTGTTKGTLQTDYRRKYTSPSIYDNNFKCDKGYDIQSFWYYKSQISQPHV